MKTTRLVTLFAILVAAVNATWATAGQYQPWSDSTGGSSQAAGELHAAPARVVVKAVAPKPGKYQPGDDSTGGTSRARAELVGA